MSLMKTVVAMVVVLGAACADNGKKFVDAQAGDDDAPTDSGNTQVERGRYIMNTLGACTFCHTPLNPDGTRDNTRLLAGVDCFIDLDPMTQGFGCLSTRNLTNDVTGLKNATDQQIKDAFTKGLRTDGKQLSPVMPYWVFHNLTDDDQNAIVAYLRTVPAVSHQVAANEQPWADINDRVVATCNMLGMQGSVDCRADFIDPATIPMPSSTYANQASALRGRYLASEAGLCIDCHTPELPHMPADNPIPPFFPRPIDSSKFFTGGRGFFSADLGLPSPPYPAFPNMIFTRNLTPDATGLQGWSLDQIKAAISLGKDRMGNAVCAATHGSMISPYAALEPADLDDIANYVASLSPVMHDTGTDCAGPAVP